MDNSRRSIAPNEDSVTMYLSFDTDAEDKWQSLLSSQGIEMDPKLDETLEQQMQNDKNKSVLKTLIKNDNAKDQVSPLRPFDKSILNKHNALSSTPTKNISAINQDLTAVDAENKENTQPEPDIENSTLSSTIDATASTVKTNTMFNDATMDDNSVLANESNNKTNIYPLSADVILENITEVSNEESSMIMSSSMAAVLKNKDVEAVVADMVSNEQPSIKMPSDAAAQNKDAEASVAVIVNQVSEIIDKAIKLTENPSKQSKKLPVALPRPRRSFMPMAASGTTIKQRMSIVVKTTLNSPARKLIKSQPNNARRSCLPTAKPGPLGGTAAYRMSTIPRYTAISSSVSMPQTTAAAAAVATAVKAKPKEVADLVKFNCKLCTKSFRLQSLLDMHMRTHVNNVQPYKIKQEARCQFCDKQFALERALHIHLMQKCDKIPPVEKRKLEFTELNHEKKAPLPKLRNSQSAANRYSFKPRQSTMPTWKVEPPMAKIEPTNAVQMAPPVSTSKLPQKVAHSGVYRTPTKLVPCHTCGLKFKSILEYTNHCLSLHSKTQKESAYAPSAQD